MSQAPVSSSSLVAGSARECFARSFIGTWVNDSAQGGVDLGCFLASSSLASVSALTVSDWRSVSSAGGFVSGSPSRWHSRGTMCWEALFKT